MEIIYFIGLYLGCFLIASGKAIADIVSDYPNWNKSVFSKYEIDSFWGCKDNTWERKYKYENKTLKFLFSTILVWTTDIWHFANFVSKCGIILSIASSFMICTTLFDVFLHLNIFLILNASLFHVLYTFGLRKKFINGN